jgi:hypothetical protein
MTYEQAVAGFEESIQTLHLREKESLRPEVIEPLVMSRREMMSGILGQTNEQFPQVRDLSCLGAGTPPT